MGKRLVKGWVGNRHWAEYDRFGTRQTRYTQMNKIRILNTHHVHLSSHTYGTTHPRFTLPSRALHELWLLFYQLSLSPFSKFFRFARLDRGCRRWWNVLRGPSTFTSTWQSCDEIYVYAFQRCDTDAQELKLNLITIGQWFTRHYVFEINRNLFGLITY